MPHFSLISRTFLSFLSRFSHFSQPSLFDGDDPLPALSSRAGTPYQEQRGLRSRDGVGRDALTNLLRASSLPAPDATISQWRPDSSDGLRPRRTPSARRRQDRALIRSRSSVSRTQSTLSRNSSLSRGGLMADGTPLPTLDGPTTDRLDFFELWKEKQRHCMEEGDDAERPDSARNVYLESAMPHRSVARCNVQIRMKYYSGSGTGSLRGGRMLTLGVDANVSSQAISRCV